MYTDLEKTINRILLKIGAESLIRRLCNMEKNINYNSEEQFQSIKKVICKYFDIPERYIFTYFKNDTYVNARRCMLYFITMETMLEPDEILETLNMSKKTYDRYITKVTEVLQNPQQDHALYKNLQEIETIIKNSKNGK